MQQNHICLPTLLWGIHTCYDCKQIKWSYLYKNDAVFICHHIAQVCCGGVCNHSLVLCRCKQYIPTSVPDYTVSLPKRVPFIFTAVIISMSQEKGKLSTFAGGQVSSLTLGMLWGQGLGLDIFSIVVFVVLLVNVFHISRRYTMCNWTPHNLHIL
jgi:hypothetical protein